MADKDSDHEEMKEEELSKLKKESSYTYWVKHNPDFPKQNYTPQPIQGVVEQKVADKGPSVWNTLGTWEERKVTNEKVKEVFESNILGKELLHDNSMLKMEKISDLTSDVVLIFSRGKKRMGYHVTGKFHFSSSSNEVEAGFFKVHEFTDDGDEEIELVSSKVAVSNSSKSQLMQQFITLLKSSLNVIKDSM